MIFRREDFDDCIEDITPMLQMHHDEVASHKDFPIAPDWEMYKKLEAANALRIYTARDPDRKLVGYAAFHISRHLHSMLKVTALQDLIFIHPRRRGFGASFMKYCHDELASEGVHVIYVGVKDKINFGPMLERMGFEKIETLYGRVIDGGKGIEKPAT